MQMRSKREKDAGVLVQAPLGLPGSDAAVRSVAHN